ncbi:MAG: 1-acyl-sn-glycerol-3-phosphate acyltransferase [Clostridia bacterium]|nr:1-acyl-sn-glycerol-3-phosphate acyltransferase [Clostridia bacterium]
MFGDKKYSVNMFFYDISHGIVLFGGSIPMPKKYTVDKKPFRNKIKDEGMIIVGNHVSFKDPWFYSATFWNRRMFFLASELVMKDPIRDFLCRHSGCIKIDRNIADINAIRVATKTLKHKRCLAVFPEGTLHKEESEDLTEIKSGVIFLASQTGAPIIPAYSLKPKHWYNRRTIVVGEPFRISDYTKRKFLSVPEMDEIAKALIDKINECKNVFDEITGGK